MWLFPLGAAVVSGVFAWLLSSQWLQRHRPHLLAWSVALAMFAAASFAAAAGIFAGWTPLWFRVYYLFGAILNVPVLGLGTIYLLGSRRAGHLSAAVVVAASVFATYAVWGADVQLEALQTDGIPRGSEAVSEGVRALARGLSFAGFFVVTGGAAWSAVQLARRKHAHLKRLALANVLIAAGTVVVALGSAFAFYGRGLPFAVGLFAGVCLMFRGFLQTRTRPAMVGSG